MNTHVYQFPLQLRFGDVDSYGHVNNVRFLQFLEDARVGWLRESFPFDAGGNSMSSKTFDFVTSDFLALVGRQEIEYLEPLLYRVEPIVVNLWTTRLGISSFDLGYSIAERDGSRFYAYAATSMVLVSRTTGRPVPIPIMLRAAFDSFAGTAVPFRRRSPLPSTATS